MIAVDTSALMAILLNEPEADRADAALRGADTIKISAVTLAEALIVSRRRSLGADMMALIKDMQAEIVPLDSNGAAQAAAAYDRWGKGVHRASLNLGDCFAYALAKANSCPLLFVGKDFARTDIQPAIQR